MAGNWRKQALALRTPVNVDNPLAELVQTLAALANIDEHSAGSGWVRKNLH
jgi:hypothetical protein